MLRQMFLLSLNIMHLDRVDGVKFLILFTPCVTSTEIIHYESS